MGVSYTTTIGACAKKGNENAAAAAMWLARMRSRGVRPNFHTYNTALAACLDGELASTALASQIATEMLEDAETELACGLKGSADFRSALPDGYTKLLAIKLTKQLREKTRRWRRRTRITNSPCYLRCTRMTIVRPWCK